MSDGLKSNVLSVTSTFCVLHRQSLKSGFVLIPGVTQVACVATDGSTRVQRVPALSGLSGPQNRLAFSQRTTPDQLSSKTFPVMSKLLSVGAGDPAVRPGFGDVDRPVGKPGFGRTLADRVVDEGVVGDRARCS